MSEEFSKLWIQTPGLEFTTFPELPTELRLKIWNYASRTCRVIDLQYCIVDRKFFSFQHLPAVLHTCHESRGVALGVYHLAFGTDKHPPGTYFNPFTDVIYLGSKQYDDEIEYIIEYFRKQSASLKPQDHIQILALAEYLWRRDCRAGPFAIRRGPWSIQRFHGSFPHLKELIFVKGKIFPFDSMTEDDDISPRGSSGASLVRIKPNPILLSNPDLTLNAVMTTFVSGKADHPEILFPDVTVIDNEVLKDHTF